MSDPFDYDGLTAHIRAIRTHDDAHNALRERIEAAFVPVSAAKALMDEKHKQAAEAKLWFTKAQEWREIAARAEAAEARVASLTAQLAEARQAERAAVGNWLRAGAGKNVQNLDRSTKALFLRGLHSYADAIEEGSHLT